MAVTAHSTSRMLKDIDEAIIDVTTDGAGDHTVPHNLGATPVFGNVSNLGAAPVTCGIVTLGADDVTINVGAAGRFFVRLVSAGAHIELSST
jgi:hypothetical protein